MAAFNLRGLLVLASCTSLTGLLPPKAPLVPRCSMPMALAPSPEPAEAFDELASLFEEPAAEADASAAHAEAAEEPASTRRKSRRKKAMIAVVGRPNVGKSTIANRLTQNFHEGGLVFNEAGVTRDRTYGEGFWGGHEFTVVDTGGIVFDDKEGEVFLPQIRQQAMLGIAEASSVLLVVDGQTGKTVLDEQISAFLRRQKVPVVLAVNKCESTVDGAMQAADFWSLGLGNPFPVSGLHGTGMGDVMDELIKPLPPPPEEGEGCVLRLLMSR